MSILLIVFVFVYSMLLLGAIIDKISSSSFFPIAQEFSKIWKDIRETIITIEKVRGEKLFNFEILVYFFLFFFAKDLRIFGNDVVGTQIWRKRCHGRRRRHLRQHAREIVRSNLQFNGTFESKKRN